MTDKQTGGPAFPTHPEGALIHDGMTLRDYFASKAMQAEISFSGYFDSERNPESIAERSYEIADAMLFLCSAQAGYMTGQLVNVDGGFSGW
jgi:NAD(P)-dependent dehydrogenase (short-subunit alcohol dehydrogenase family)